MNQATLVKAGAGPNYNYSQDHCFVKVSSDQTNGALGMVEDTLKPGFHLARHHHKVMTEVFYMLEGELELLFDDQSIILKPGDTITVPPNIWHEARCKAGGRMLTIFKDGQFDRYLERLSQLPEEAFKDEAKMQKLNEEFDVYN